MRSQMTDRRVAPRLRAVHELHIVHPSNDRDIQLSHKGNPNAMLIDLSDHGIGLVTKEPLGSYSTAFIQFDVNGISVEPSCFKIEIVWRHPQVNRYGARFLVPEKEKEQLRMLIKRVGKSFIFDRTVYLTDTNAEGNAYFARHFDWEGETREAYLKQAITPQEYKEMVKTRTRLITVSASLDYFKPLWLFDEVRVRMTTRNIRHASLEMIFTFFNKLTGELVAKGKQCLAFQDKRGHLISVPPFIRRIALLIEEEEDHTLIFTKEGNR